MLFFINNNMTKTTPRVLPYINTPHRINSPITRFTFSLYLSGIGGFV
jgi:hypothetical protein